MCYLRPGIKVAVEILQQTQVRLAMLINICHETVQLGQRQRVD